MKKKAAHGGITTANLQRLDGSACSAYFEFDSGSGSGLSSGRLPYNSGGVTSGLSFKLGSGAYDCTSTVAAGQELEIVCSSAVNPADVCTMYLAYGGPLS